MDEVDRRRLVTDALQQLPVSVVVTSGPDLRLAALSDGARRLVGDREPGTPLADGAGPVEQRVVECFAEVFRSGRPFVGHEWLIEVRGPDDQLREVAVDFAVLPVRDLDEQVVGTIGIGEDVTQRVRNRGTTLAEPGEEHRVPVSSELLMQLQDALLPSGLPVVPGAEIAARYLPAEDESVAGGDWFDALALADGRVVMTVGDVVGHGVDAAVTMGELRTVFEDRVCEQGDLGAALGALDRLAARRPEAVAATVCAAVLDPATGDLHYCTAGHPPPVVVTPDGRATFLPSSGAGALGSEGGRFPRATHHLAPGELVLLYSNGLVDRPGRTSAQGTLDVLRAVELATRGTGPSAGHGTEPVVDRVCRRTLELLTRVTGYADDITVLAVQRVAPVAPLRLVLPAVPDSVRAARLDLDAWLSRLHVGLVDGVAVRHAIGELVSNAVQHAYDDPGVGDEVRVTADLRPEGCLEVDVADDGRWRDGGAAAGGRGLAMVRAFVDDLVIDVAPEGTRCHLRHLVAHPASMLRATSRGPVRAPAGGDLALAVDEDGRLHVEGAVDGLGAERLRRTLDHLSRGGTRTVFVDLSQVTLLASAGVRVLIETRRAGPARFHAPPGSAAQHVLEVAHLDYDA